MKRIVIAPDSFKGSLSAAAAAAAIAAGLQRVWPDAACIAVPMADGGEGTLDACLAAGGERRHAEVTGAAGPVVDAEYGLLERDGRKVALIEVAQIVGITDPGGMAVPVGYRSSIGVGELIRQILDVGVREIFIGLGGSSTNDGGAGMLAGVGARLLGGGAVAEESLIPPQPESLAGVRVVDLAALDPRLADCRIIIMSDVDNPWTGPQGATAIFGPQKGVTAALVRRYDDAIAAFAVAAERAFGREVAGHAGAGAAGGLGFALQLLGGEFQSGAEVIADLLGLDAALANADWAITGEGRSDLQTLHGKTPFVVARHAARQGVPVSLLSGGIDRTSLPALGRTFAGCFSLVFGPLSLEDAMRQTAELLSDAAEQMARLRTAMPMAGC